MATREDILRGLQIPTLGETATPRRLGRAEILAGLQVPAESPTPLQLFTPEQLQAWRGAQPVEREDWTDFGGPLGDIVKIIDYPRAFVASTMKEIGDIFTGEMPSLGDWWTQGSENYLWGEHLQDWGVDLPGPLDMMLGVGLDVATDVMTYMWGIGALARIGKAGVDWSVGSRMMFTMAGQYDEIAKGGGKAAAAAKAKSEALRIAAGEVGSKRALSAAPQWALKEIGLDKRIGLFVPGTGRLGRWVGFDKLLDYASSGRVTSARARQVAKLPVTEAIWNPDPAKIRGIRHTLGNSVEEMVRREAVAGATPHWYTPAAVRGRMADIAKGARVLDPAADPLLTQMAQKARVAPVEMWKGPLWTGKAVKAVGGAPGALMRQTFASNGRIWTVGVSAVVSLPTLPNVNTLCSLRQRSRARTLRCCGSFSTRRFVRLIRTRVRLCWTLKEIGFCGRASRPIRSGAGSLQAMRILWLLCGRRIVAGGMTFMSLPIRRSGSIRSGCGSWKRICIFPALLMPIMRTSRPLRLRRRMSRVQRREFLASCRRVRRFVG